MTLMLAGASVIFCSKPEAGSRYHGIGQSNAVLVCQCHAACEQSYTGNQSFGQPYNLVISRHADLLPQGRPWAAVKSYSRMQSRIIII
tara:strand:- start:11070 stop:11333 length:264 start_codon:yes stop_codon:yes gene_type:complete